MEKESNHEREPLDVHYFELAEQIESDMISSLGTLDEFLIVGAKYYQKYAREGNEFHEELGKMAMVYLHAKDGSYHKEKAAFCSKSAEVKLAQAKFYNGQGNQELAQDAQRRARNWLKMWVACLAMPKG